MISYEPLMATLQKRKVSVGSLGRAIGDRGLKRKLNTRNYISLATIEKICEKLDCKVENVICYKEGEHKLLDNWIMAYKIDWVKVKKLLNGKSWHKASLEMRMKGSYLGNCKKSATSRRPFVNKLAEYLQKDPSEFCTPIRFELNKEEKDEGNQD